MRLWIIGAIFVFALVPILYFEIHGASLEGFRISQDGIRLSTNIDKVGDDGQLIRSAQLTAAELADVIQKYKIRTVINLQGARPGYKWYDDEIALAKKENLEHFDFGLSTETIPKAADLRRILGVLRESPYPILLHCRSGSDRTGLISAIYAYDFLHRPKEVAARELSEKFWHTSFFTPAQEYFFKDVYQNAAWALKSYDDCDPNLRYVDTRGCPSLK